LLGSPFYNLNHSIEGLELFKINKRFIKFIQVEYSGYVPVMDNFCVYHLVI
jgi:hypothetical protein